MRPDDLEQLSTAIPEADPRSPDQQFADALGVSLPRWRALNSAIRADLDRDSKGVKWWTGLDESQRQLISHQLTESLATVPGLLTRARLHLLEVAHAVDLLNAAPHCVVVHSGGTGEPRQQLLRYESAAEHLPSELEQLHIAGFVHALFSALDVVGGVIIGVAGVPRSILTKADFGVAMSALANPAKSAVQAHRDAWLQLHQEVSAALATPADWHLWLADLRNTVAHRAKIPTLHLVVPNGRAALSGADLVRFVNIETRLPRQPARAFLQSLAANPHEVYLDEPAAVTLTGLLNSTVKLVELTSDALAKLWERRRSGDLQLAQPPEQWPKLEPAPARSFAGFAPGPALTGDLQWATSPDAFSSMDGTGVGKRS
jgi:hypothetical protein